MEKNVEEQSGNSISDRCRVRSADATEEAPADERCCPDAAPMLPIKITNFISDFLRANEAERKKENGPSPRIQWTWREIHQVHIMAIDPIIYQSCCYCYYYY